MTKTIFIALLALSAAAAAPAAQEPAAPAGAGQAKLAEWPPLKDTDKERVLALVGQFKKDNEALQKGAREQLIALGEAAVPLLFKQVTDQPDSVNEQLFSVFDQVLGPQHGPLMARESKKPKLELRRYLVRRLCRFVDADLQPVLQAASKDKDPEVAFCGHLGLLGLRQRESLPPVLERCRKNWSELRPLVAEVLPHARGDELGRAVAEAIAKAAPPVQATGLRLMRYLGTKEQTVIVRTYLQAEDHNVKKEAVNAMRALNGMEPIENLSVFQAIEMAKEWLNK